MKKIVLAVVMILVFSVSVSFAETYEEWLSTCKDYKDVAKWMKRNFLYDIGRSGRVWGPNTDPKDYPSRSPEETFKSKRGLCIDAAVFAKVSLNKINQEYKSEVIYLRANEQKFSVHYVAGFYEDGKMFVLDYGIPSGKSQGGTWGPFENLDEYVKKVYLRWSEHREMKEYHLGWPEYRKFEKW